MNAIYLVRMLKTNAAVITSKEALIDMHVQEARHMRARGEIAYSIDEFKSANYHRTKLVPLVETQRAIKAELRHLKDSATIAAFQTFVVDNGIKHSADFTELTVREAASLCRAVTQATKAAIRAQKKMFKEAA